MMCKVPGLTLKVSELVDRITPSVRKFTRKPRNAAQPYAIGLATIFPTPFSFAG
jgi:hypothetical protein